MPLPDDRTVSPVGKAVVVVAEHLQRQICGETISLPSAPQRFTGFGDTLRRPGPLVEYRSWQRWSRLVLAETNDMLATHIVAMGYPSDNVPSLRGLYAGRIRVGPRTRIVDATVQITSIAYQGHCQSARKERSREKIRGSHASQSAVARTFRVKTVTIHIRPGIEAGKGQKVHRYMLADGAYTIVNCGEVIWQPCELQLLANGYAHRRAYTTNCASHLGTHRSDAFHPST
jgi:hypothetical protein